MTTVCADAMRKARVVKGFTQGQVEDGLGLHRGFVGKCERGELDPRLGTCLRLCVFYGVTLDQLTGMTPLVVV